MGGAIGGCTRGAVPKIMLATLLRLPLVGEGLRLLPGDPLEEPL